MRVVIMGSGNVAETLALALKEADMAPVQIFARNTQEGTAIAEMCGADYTSDADQLAEADLYLIAITDKAISNLAGTLKFGSGVVAHTAGSVPIDVLPSKIRDAAVFYPLQTFTKGRRVDFKEIPIIIEGRTPKALDVVNKVATQISDNVRTMDSEQRALLHLSAVFACNFTNHMYVIGELIAERADADFSILKPLIRETAEKAIAADSPIHVQTGPAIRNDFQTKSRHCDMLLEAPDLKSIYISLSKSIWEISKKI